VPDGLGDRVRQASALLLGAAVGLLAACSQFGADDEAESTFQLPPLTTATTVPAPTTTFPTTYVVQDGDTMDAIAHKLGIPLGDLVAANLNLPTPDYIQPGWILRIPPPPASTTTTLSPG
jgi:nucleoid-associated protein YgaU